MPTQAVAAWRWCSYFSSHVAQYRDVLRLGFGRDLGALRDDGKGSVVASPKRHREEPIQWVFWWDRRGCMTHVGLVCNLAHIQPRLSQVTIGYASTLPSRSVVSLRAACPSSAILSRRRGACVNRGLYVSVCTFDARP